MSKSVFRAPKPRLASAACLAALLNFSAPASATPSTPPARPAAEVFATPDPADLGRPALRIFNDVDGLPHNTIQSIVTDHRGYLWVGTQDGAVRYDGHVWSVVDMPNKAASNYVRVILETRDGSLWFGRQNGGVAHLSAGNWNSFDVGTGLSSTRVNTLRETRGPDGRDVLWVGTYGGGICRYAGGSWSVVRKENGLADDRVWQIREIEGDDGSPILLAGTEGGVSFFDGKKWAPFLPGVIPAGLSINSLLQTRGSDGRRTLWLGAFGVGVLEIRNGALTQHDAKSGFPSPFITSLASSISPAGEIVLWAGTTNGLARYSRRRWNVLDTNRGLPAPEIYCLESNPSAGGSLLWIGTRGGGLVRLSPWRWTAFDKGLGLAGNQVFSIKESGPIEDPTIWVGTSSGLSGLKRGVWNRIDTSAGLPGIQISSLAETVAPDGTSSLWVGTSVNGLARFDGKRWSPLGFRNGLPASRINQLLATQDEKGKPVLWVATDGLGVGRFKDERWSTFDLRSGLSGPSSVNALFETAAPHRAIWAGTRLGVVRIEGEKVVPMERSRDLPSPDVQGFAEIVLAGGIRELWIATRGGIARVNLANPAAPLRLLSDSSRPALPGNLVLFARQGLDGRIYLGTNKGVVRLTPRFPTTENGAEFDIRFFTTEDGLPTNACTWASTVDRKGRIWAGTMAGVAVLDPTAEIEDRLSKPLALAEIVVNGQSRPAAPNGSFRHDERDFEFSYSLLSYFGERATRYRTQLVGFDSAPSHWVAETKRAYTNLAPGSYTFRVWGRDSTGNVTGPVESAFVIRPALWFTWWAWILYVASGIGLVHAGLRIRLGNLRRHNLELELKVQERTLQLAAARDQALEATRAKSAFLANVSHELRTPLNAIIGYSELLIEEVTDSNEQVYVPDLEKIRGAARHQLTLISDVLDLAKVEAGKIELGLALLDVPRLVEEVASTVRPLAARNQNRFEVRCPADAGFMHGDITRVKQVLLNLLSNAFKFTERGVVTLEVDRELSGSGESFFVIRIRDTGLGMSPEQIARLFQSFVQVHVSTAAGYGGTGLGLVISRRLCQLMGGDIEVASEVGKGTTFTVRLPRDVAGPSMPVTSGRAV